MKMQFGQIIGNQKKGFFSAIRTLALSGDQFGLHFPASLIQSFREHSNILVRTLDTVKRRFGLVAHKYAFPGIGPMLPSCPV